MKTSYAEAEKQCKSGDRNGDVADFKTRFTTWNIYDWKTSTTELTVDEFEYEPEDHPNRKYYEESMQNLR